MRNSFKRLFIRLLYLIAMVLGPCCSGELHAQLPNFDWAIGMRSNYDGNNNTVAVDPAGNVYSVGNFSANAVFGTGPTSVSLNSSGMYDGFIQKQDALGNLLWVNKLGSAGNENVNALAVDASGNLYTAGYFQNSIDFDPSSQSVVQMSSAGGGDIFIQKYDADGQLFWVRTMGSVSSDAVYDIAVDEAGNVYCTGYFYETIDFDPGPGTAIMTSQGLEDAFILKLDASGNFVWVRTASSPGLENGLAIALDASGKVYTAGSFENTVDFDPGGITPSPAALTSKGYTDIFIQKLSADGALIWVKSIGSTYYDFLKGLAVDTAGNVFASGDYTSTMDFDPGPAEFNLAPLGYDIFMLRLDASGNFDWAFRMGDAEIQRGGDVAVDSSGNVYTTGSFAGTVDFDPGSGEQLDTSTMNSTDCYIQKLDASGALVWAFKLGSNSLDRGAGIALDGNGNVYAGGQFYGTVDFDPGVGVAELTGQPLGLFVLKLSQNTVGTSETPDASDFVVFPNPVQNTLTIQAMNLATDGAPYFIADLYGRKWMEGKIYGTTTRLDLSPLPSGILVLSIGAQVRTLLKR